ncbi:uncharacterized protein [Leuresthes tenuis]|uniref:uncharacterized protein n=1 Tax=Leuresthes tenuis TaxID=355514 RepID=UPI003B50994F
MDWTVTAILLLSVLKAALCFNIEPLAWKSLKDAAAGFGYQVVQRKSDLLVSAPFKQYSGNQRGQIFKCTTDQCQSLQLQVPQSAVNMSLGLAMTSDPSTEATVACGPTIPKDCKSITMYNGLCIEIDKYDTQKRTVPSAIEECQTQADIAFLLDGSGSVRSADFDKMKTFVRNLIASLLGKDTQFAIVQFSTQPRIHYYFNTFRTNNWQTQIQQISQSRGYTYTARAITHLVGNVFSPAGGSRSKVKKILIVITDGESNDSGMLKGAIQSAENKNIVRFAIGVGNAFGNPSAINELNTIASHPPANHVFKVQGFEALEKIRQNLQDKIFSIEGSQSSGDTLTLEMSQEGFKAAYIPGGIQMSIVGANQWRGGYKKHTSRTMLYEPKDVDPDSYLGYSMAVAKVSDGSLTIIGAPRYQHKGLVRTVQGERTKQTILPHQWQSGEYFGAEVCAMNLKNDEYTDLILISSPMYKDSDREGRVYVCTLTFLNVECHFDSPLVLRGDASDKGRFGSSLAVLPDLNKNGFNDLAVGAPLENDGQGSIYIFHGEGGKSINPIYSQRIAASEVQSGLKFFGMSISQSSFDQSGDGLPDLAVGSKGTVVLLRSKPVVMVEATVTFSPKEIPTQNVTCSKPLENTAKICFTMHSHSAVNTAEAQINYTLTLDATRKTPNNRAYISKKRRDETGSFTVDLRGQKCSNVNFYIEACQEDIFNPLKNELTFTFDGVPSITNLKPSLSQQAKKTTFHPLGFEINCGADNNCVDNLKVDFNFTKSSEVKVGIDELLDVTVSVENREENSYNSHVTLTYPVGLSYRKFTTLQGRIECNSLDSEDGVTRGKTDCSIDKPIFKSKSKAVFIVSYGIGTNSGLDKRIFVTANATSGNQQHSPSSELYMKREINVKSSIFVSVESSLTYSNFTSGKNNLQKPVEQLIKVTNHIRVLNFTVVIKVPVKLGDKDIWVDSNTLQIEDCQTHKDEEPVVTDFVAQIKENKLVDCSVARCRVFKCTKLMGRLESVTYMLSANLSSGWIEQIGLQSAKFLLTSTASLEYDRDQYVFFSTATNNTPPVRKIETEVEVYPEPDFTKEIVGGSLGGLAFLALLTAVLYKAGFFKSKYSEMVNPNEGAADAEADGGAPKMLKAALCFNIEPLAWKSLKDAAAGFGYQVVQRKSDLLVSAPFKQYSGNQRGQIFKCTTDQCQSLQLQVPQSAVNMSLGLAMTSDPSTEATVACGPTIPKDCKSITMYNGLCIEIDKYDTQKRTVPSAIEECQTQADIAFLLDGSGSVRYADFDKMKTFVINLIASLFGKDTQFAIVQFSTQPRIHYYFNTFRTNNWQTQIQQISQSRGYTYTARAIKHLVDKVFSPAGGSRSKVKKILIVITDGKSSDSNHLKGAIQSAENKNIVRFAIGVGNAFGNPSAINELNTIASDPPVNHVFKVQGFEALEKIRQNLQDKIFSIEGSQSSGDTLTLEMSQEGFKAAYIPGGIQMSIVGANQWRGGYKKHTSRIMLYDPMDIDPDSYLGYSMAVAKVSDGSLTIIGAPRYQHKGLVRTVQRERTKQTIVPYQWQSGEYFGAEVCAMNLKNDEYTDLILISSPMYKDSDREGRVYVCRLTYSNVECHFDSPLVLRGDASDKGRFGSSLAVLPDLNKDGFNDLAVGAPLENDGQGSIYIFHGEGGKSINPIYSQRIAASEVQSGLKFFGMSISQSSFDQSGDGLPDLAVGSKGTVVLLRSKPVVMVEATVTFSPKEIPTQNVTCSKPLENTAKICFTMHSHSAVNTAEAQINYTLTLDATRKTPNNRAYISKKRRDETGSFTVDLRGQKCSNVNFYIEACQEDILNPLKNELTFTFDGVPSITNLKPSLSQQAKKTTFHPLGFEINCGVDDNCVDNLKVDFNFTKSLEVKVGIDELLDVTVSVENREENSYNSHVTLTYPVGLSYRKFTTLQGRIECNSLDSEDGVTRGKTDCSIDKPIFKSKSKAVFIVSYGIGTNSGLDKRIFVTANATSGNQQHSPSSELYMKREINVKSSIFVSVESSLTYSNFTSGKNNLQKPVEQLIKVTNHIRVLNFTVVIKVPVKLGDKDIWVDSNTLQIEDCQTHKDEEPVVTDFVAQIKENKLLIGLQSAKFLLTSTASLEYDRDQYIFFSTATNNTPPVRKIETEVEVYPEPDFTKEIVGGSLGGLAFLALLTAVLYKVGFFKSKYSAMVNQNDEGAADAEADGGAPGKK